jgi:uncharacterized protein YifE (UPF0438 family)
MDITINHAITAKAEAIRQLLTAQGIDKLSKDHPTIFAKKIDGALREAGFESHYFHDLSMIESKALQKNTVQKSLTDLLRNDGMPSDILIQVEKVWSKHMDALLKEINLIIAESEKNRPHNPIGTKTPHHNHIEIETPHHIKKLAGLANGLKYAAIGIAPPGIDIAFYYNEAEQVLNKAQQDLNKQRLSPEQFQIISKTTENTFMWTVGASVIPDPSGISSDAAVHYGNKRAMEELLTAGLTKTQAENYQIGSFIQIMENAADTVSKAQSNKNDIAQLKNANNGIPLSVALDYSASQLASFGKMSETLDGNALKLEVERHPDFEKLAHLASNDLSLLSKLVNAGIDPEIRVNAAHEIIFSPQQLIDSYENPATKTRAEENVIADNNSPSVSTVVKTLASSTVDMTFEKASQFSDQVKAVISDPKIINDIITQEIRTQHCKDLKDKLDNGGKPITQHQIDQCIAFATGDMEELQRLSDLSTSKER